MSVVQGQRTLGEERSRRGRPAKWIVPTLIPPSLLAVLILFAPEVLGGGRGGGFGGISPVTIAVVGGGLILGFLAARLLWLWVGLLRSRRGE